MNNELQNKIDEALFKFYLEADSDTIQDLLRENIQSEAEYQKKINKFLFMAKATAKKRNNEQLLVLINKFQDALSKNIEKPISMLRQLIQDNPSFVLYNNLDKLSRENVIDIIKDKNLSELIDQLKEDEKNG